MRATTLGLLALATALSACASSGRRPDYPLITEEDDPAAHAANIDGDGDGDGDDGRLPAAAAPPPRGPLARSGSILRADLDTVLDAGPAVFLSGLRIDAEIQDRRLRGWRIRAFWPDDPRFARVDLLPGDLVLSVNGRLIVRPEHLQRVWDSLRDATGLVVEVERAGSVYRLEYTIVDSPPLPGSNPGPGDPR